MDRRVGTVRFLGLPTWRRLLRALAPPALSIGLAAVTAVPLLAQTGTVQGRVLDQLNSFPIEGAEITVVGTDIGTVTAEDGSYLLSDVPAGRQRVTVRSLGYVLTTGELTVVAATINTLDFELRRSVIALDAIVVTGTAGEARKRSVANTISSLDAEKIDEPVMDVDAMLQARSAGVTVLKSSAMAGSGAQIRLRGNVSVAMSNQPLIYVDGVRIRSDGYPKNVPPVLYQGRSGNDVASPLNDIDPNDIERMEVIKGAAATTLYGTEAASGVIQIFTKKGRRGPSRWTVQVDQGFNHTLKFGPNVNWEALKDDPEVCPLPETGPPRSCDPSYMYIDPWLRNAWRQKYSLSVAGGTEALSYYTSGTFEDNDGVLPNDWERRYVARGNFGFSPLENLHFALNTSYTSADISNTPAGNNAQGLTLNAYRRDRNYAGSLNIDTISQVLDFDIKTYIDHYIAGLTTRWTPTENLLQRLTFGYDLALSEMRSIRPFGFRWRSYGILSNRRWSNTTLTLDYLGTLDADVSSTLHSSFSWGAQFITDDEGDVYGFGRDLPPGDATLSSAATTLSFESRQRVVTGGFFVQNVFGFKDRLFLTGGVRVDGNSAFGEKFGLQPYPKVGASYVISDEPFWPSALGTMKLRAAYGQAGRAPGAFDAVRTWNPVGWGGIPAYRPLNVGNDSLGPERTTEIEAGFEAALLDDRLALDFSYYYQKTTDALFSVRQIPSLGFLGSQLDNVGEIQNKGIEANLNATILNMYDLGWDLTFNAYTNRSKVLSLGGAPAFGIGSFGWIVDSAAAAEMEIRDSKGNPVTEGLPVPAIVTRCARHDDGSIAYYSDTKTDDPTYDLNCYHGPNLPTLTLGVGTTLRLPKGITLSARGEYQGGHFMYDGAAWNAIRRSVKWPSCFPAYELMIAGDTASLSTYQKAACIVSNARADYMVYPADFFKVRDVTLRLPISFLVPGGRTASLTLSGRNVWRWRNKDMPLFDPEMMGNEGMNASVRSILEHVPPPATYTASVRVIF